MTQGQGIPGLANRYFRPHAWAYGVAVFLWAVLALSSVASWLFWPFMVWTILFLLHFLVVKSLNIDSAWVDERADKTAKKALSPCQIGICRFFFPLQWPELL